MLATHTFLCEANDAMIYAVQLNLCMHGLPTLKNASYASVLRGISRVTYTVLNEELVSGDHKLSTCQDMWSF